MSEFIKILLSLSVSAGTVTASHFGIEAAWY